MTDPYETLGVPKGAPKSEIRKAYRKQAKKAHPDAGGSPEEFALVKAAHDTLTDDKMRAHYDRTGEFKGKEPDNSLGDMLQCVSYRLDKVLERADQSYGGVDTAIQSNVVAKIQDEIRRTVCDLSTNLENAKKARKLNERMLKRFRRKKSDGEPNMMEWMIGGRLAEITDAIRQMEKNQETAERAIKFLADYEFDPEQAPPKQRRTWADEIFALMGVHPSEVMR